MVSLLRRNRDFRAVLVAQIISYCGDWFATVALLGVVLDLTHSALAATLVFVAQALPSFVMTPFAGPAADRFDRRRLLILVSTGQVLAALGFLLIGHQVWIGFAAEAAISMLGAFFQPASQAALPNLVDDADLPAANVLMSSTWGAMLAVGAALGGVFTLAFGRTASFVADAASFAIAAALIATVRRSMNGARSRSATRLRPLADSAEGLRYAWSHPEVLALLGSKMGFGLASGAAGLLAVFATTKFHAGDGGTGLLLAARGVGVVAGPLLIGRAVRRGTGAILAACGAAGLVFALGYALLPFIPVLGLAAAAVLVAHLGGGSQWTLSTYGLQTATEDEFRGRIFATDYASVTLTMSASYTAAGAAAARWGPGPVTLVLAGLAGAWSLIYLTLTRKLRISLRAAPAESVPLLPETDPESPVPAQLSEA